jgi:hypothetical protein
MGLTAPPRSKRASRRIEGKQGLSIPEGSYIGEHARDLVTGYSRDTRRGEAALQGADMGGAAIEAQVSGSRTRVVVFYVARAPIFRPSYSNLAPWMKQETKR